MRSPGGCESRNRQLSRSANLPLMDSFIPVFLIDFVRLRRCPLRASASRRLFYLRRYRAHAKAQPGNVLFGKRFSQPANKFFCLKTEFLRQQIVGHRNLERPPPHSCARVPAANCAPPRCAKPIPAPRWPARAITAPRDKLRKHFGNRFRCSHVLLSFHDVFFTTASFHHGDTEAQRSRLMNESFCAL